jgi:hypothetical protein
VCVLHILGDNYIACVYCTVQRGTFFTAQSIEVQLVYCTVRELLRVMHSLDRYCVVLHKLESHCVCTAKNIEALYVYCTV